MPSPPQSSSKVAVEQGTWHKDAMQASPSLHSSSALQSARKAGGSPGSSSAAKNPRRERCIRLGRPYTPLRWPDGSAGPANRYESGRPERRRLAYTGALHYSGGSARKGSRNASVRKPNPTLHTCRQPLRCRRLATSTGSLTSEQCDQKPVASSDGDLPSGPSRGVGSESRRRRTHTNGWATVPTTRARPS